MPPDVCLDWVGLLFTVYGLLTMFSGVGCCCVVTCTRWNVEQGRLLETPTFEWLDAHETKTTCFWLSMWSTPAVVEECIVTLKQQVSGEKEDEVLTEGKVVYVNKKEVCLF